jgi:hypothetical protein
VLGRLYAKYFPAYFGTEQLTALLDALRGPAEVDDGSRWRNLWRPSDYLGGEMGNAVTSGAPAGELDRRLIDPLYPIPAGELGFPRPIRHSNYPLDPAFQETVGELADLLPGEPLLAVPPADDDTEPDPQPDAADHPPVTAVSAPSGTSRMPARALMAIFAALAVGLW